MDKRGQQFLAIFLISLGAIYLLANIFNISAGKLFWPLIFILVGVVLIFRPKAIAPSNAKHYFAGDIDLDASWTPRDEEIRMFAGDIDIDLKSIELPAGETTIWVRFFAGDVRLDVPDDVGVRVSCNAFVVDAKMQDGNTSNVMTGFEYQSDNYDEAEKKFNLNSTSFAMDLKIR